MITQGATSRFPRSEGKIFCREDPNKVKKFPRPAADYDPETESNFSGSDDENSDTETDDSDSAGRGSRGLEGFSHATAAALS